MDDPAISKLWYEIANCSPSDILPGVKARRIEDPEPHPGFVGRQYQRSGTLLLGAAPTKDETGARDQMIAEALAGLDGGVATFHALSEATEEAMQDWPYYNNVVGPLIERLGLNRSDVALINLLPWKKGDEKPFSDIYEECWNKITRHQIELLSPSRIIALGDEAYTNIEKLRRWRTPLYKVRITRGSKTTGRSTREDIERLAGDLNPQNVRPSDALDADARAAEALIASATPVGELVAAE